MGGSVALAFWPARHLHQDFGRAASAGSDSQGGQSDANSASKSQADPKSAAQGGASTSNASGGNVNINANKEKTSGQPGAGASREIRFKCSAPNGAQIKVHGKNLPQRDMTDIKKMAADCGKKVIPQAPSQSGQPGQPGQPGQRGFVQQAPDAAVRCNAASAWWNTTVCSYASSWRSTGPDVTAARRSSSEWPEAASPTAALLAAQPTPNRAQTLRASSGSLHARVIAMASSIAATCPAGWR